MQNMQKEPEKFGMKENFNLMYLLASSHALCFTPFLRKGYGMEAFGIPALIAGGMIWFYASCMNAPEMFVYLLMWILAIAAQRADSFKADRRGAKVHSRYLGWPDVALRTRLVTREVTAKLFVEPAICLGVGAFLWLPSPAMGAFVMWGALSLLFIEATHRQLRRARVRILRDAQIEQEQLMQQFNRLTDDF